eukprot:TRINITY_DN8330_c0_g1_i1.p1 TRINITY_DN8330_c0_g1~~TRINITY_DN8330_c0_g1_i1.p1  ORF type:complete len:116 (-),score=42.26 TRINITY_DN8330_c0_g1_i1:339-686(-)
MASYVESSDQNPMESISQETPQETSASAGPSGAPAPESRKRKSLGYYFRLAMAKSRVISSIQRQRESKDSVEGDLGEVSRKTKKLSQKFNSSLKMPRGIKSDQEETSGRTGKSLN